MMVGEEQFAEISADPEAERETLQSGGSFLLADIGRGNTSAALFDLVDGRQRFVARGTALTTSAAPRFDVIHGLQQAIGQITEITGRQLANELGVPIRPSRADGSGVDYFGAITSAAEPLRVFVIGLLEDVSLASVRRALKTNYIVELDGISMADTRSHSDQVESLLNQPPDLVMIVGGTEGNSGRQLLKLVEILAIALDLMDSAQRPLVLYAGNSRLHSQVDDLLGELADLFVIDNIRPEYEVERLDHAIGALSELYLRKRIGATAGMDEVLRWSSFPVMTTSHAFGGIVEYFAALHKGRVLGLDLGSHSTTFVSATPEKADLVVRTDLGLGGPIRNLLQDGCFARILEWASAEATASELQDFIYQKSLRTQTVPLSEKELRLEQAVLREIVRSVVANAAAEWGWSSRRLLPPFELLLLRGGILADSPRPGSFLLAVLDALQPTGMFRVVLDELGVLPAMGLLASEQPRAVVEVLDSGALTQVAFVVAPSGRARKGRPALRLRLDVAHGDSQQIEVKAGSLAVLPLQSDQTAVLNLKPSAPFNIGAGPGKGRKVKIRGGIVGLVIDARGRPLALPPEDAARDKLLQQWQQQIGG